MSEQVKNITVAIPVYGDWPSLANCIESLKQHLDSQNKVILLNDQGPDCELIEAGIKKSITGHKNFEYHRNSENLGFVKTCNRIVLEIDKSGNDILLLNSDTLITKNAISEMAEVLYISENHGAVSPRSNNATICSVPFLPRSNSEIRDDLDYSDKIYQKLIKQLPRFNQIPVAHGYCMLIRRELIDKYGLFDEIYGLGYGEESDFCMRIEKHGYISVMANQAYVAHMESRSFTSEKKLALMRQNEQTLLSRYPDYNQKVTNYINYDIDPVDWFGDLLFGPDQPAKALIYVSSKTPKPQVEKLANAIEELKGSKVAITISSDKNSNLNFYAKAGHRVIDSSEINELFHIGYSPFLNTTKDLLILNKRCLRVIADSIEHQDYLVTPNHSKSVNKIVIDELAQANKTDLANLRKRWEHFSELAKKADSKRSLTKSIKTTAKNKLRSSPRLYKTARSAYKKVKR